MEADVDVRLLQSAIRGQPIDEAVAYLSDTLPLEDAPVVEVTPSWLKRVPWMPFRISIVQERLESEVARVLPGP
jgi:hypothetical protein